MMQERAHIVDLLAPVSADAQSTLQNMMTCKLNSECPHDFKTI